VRVPVLQGILPVDRARVPADVLAGVTLAALGIPEVMGYTKIAGTPVITGLYTILIPIAVFALLGSSRHLVVGADSATAAILAAGLVGMAPLASPDYVSLAGIVAILAGGMLLLARVVRLGFLADFLSRSVLIGFLTGVGIQVAMGQLAGMLGVPGGTGRTLQKFIGTLKQIPDASLTTVAVSAGVLIVILGMKLITRKIPGALIAVIGSIAVSYVWDLQAHGVAVLGTVPSGLPTFGIPSFGWSTWAQLLPTAAACFLVILAQSAATSRAFAARYGEEFDENVDLVGLGAANVSAGLSGTFVVNGSPTKTEMVDSAGGRSQLAQLTTAVIVLLVLLFFTKELAYMPEAVLSSIVFLIGVQLVDVSGMRKVLRLRYDEFVVAVLTATVVVAVGVEQAIVLAIVMSIIDHLRRSYDPRNTLLSRTASGKPVTLPIPDDSADLPSVDLVDGLVVYRFTANMYFANSERFESQVRMIVDRTGGPAIRWFCLDAAAVGDVDFTAGESLLAIVKDLQAKEIRFVMSEVAAPVREQLDKVGFTDLIGADAYFETVSDVSEAYEATMSQGPGGA
jgi:SulP family sulfate permease